MYLKRPIEKYPRGYLKCHIKLNQNAKTLLLFKHKTIPWKKKERKEKKPKNQETYVRNR